jgi:ketosteroid isomerase-like protein
MRQGARVSTHYVEVRGKGCANPKENIVSAEENKQLITQGYELFQRGDIDGLLATYADDIEWCSPEMDNVPFSGSYHGKDEVRQFFTDLSNAMVPLEFAPREMIAEGDKVMVLGHEAWSVRANNRRLEGDWAHVFTIRDGMVVAFQDYAHTAAVMTAFEGQPGALSQGASLQQGAGLQQGQSTSQSQSQSLPH